MLDTYMCVKDVYKYNKCFIRGNTIFRGPPMRACGTLLEGLSRASSHNRQIDAEEPNNARVVQRYTHETTSDDRYTRRRRTSARADPVNNSKHTTHTYNNIKALEERAVVQKKTRI